MVHECETVAVTANTQGYNRFFKNIDKEGKGIWLKITSSVRNTVLQSLMIHSEDKHLNNNKTIDIADYGN